MIVWYNRPLWTPEYGTVDVVGYYISGEWHEQYRVFPGYGDELAERLNSYEQE